MLAQNFKTPTDLGLSDAEFEALVKVLGMFERGEIPDELFKMNVIGNQDCGTPGCICGWARTIRKDVFRDSWDLKKGGLRALFIRPYFCQDRQATPAEAAIAIRNYLSSGQPRWAEAMSIDD